jgi:uncharacterized membrane protein
MGGASGHALVMSARAAFINGMDAGLIVAAVITAFGAAAALVFLPAQARDDAPAAAEEDKAVEPAVAPA